MYTYIYIYITERAERLVDVGPLLQAHALCVGYTMLCYTQASQTAIFAGLYYAKAILCYAMLC